MNPLALIPARSGSKRLPGKNWLEVGGKSLVQRAVECATAAGLVPRIITDAPERCQIPGAVVVEEPPELATDDTPMIKVVMWASSGMPSDTAPIVLLQPSSPLRVPEDIEAALARWSVRHRQHVDSVVSGKQDGGGKRDGNVYVTCRETIQKYGTCYGGHCSWVITPPERSVDVDTLEDLEEARRLVG